MPFDTIAHTTPPFYSSEAWSLELTSCYHTALTAIDTLRPQHEPNTHLRIASPLLGAGARGAPLDQAAGHAA